MTRLTSLTSTGVGGSYYNNSSSLAFYSIARAALKLARFPLSLRQSILPDLMEIH